MSRITSYSRLALVALPLLAGIVLAAPAAEARVGFGFTVPLVVPPPVMVAPPMVAAPPPVVVGTAAVLCAAARLLLRTAAGLRIFLVRPLRSPPLGALDAPEWRLR